MTMWIFNQKRYVQTTLTAIALLLGGCGMAEGDEDDRNRRIYLAFDDAAFEEFCLAHYDLNGDGRFSRYEAERVLHLDCSGMGITSLALIGEFKRLETLDCSNNGLTTLDIEQCGSLQRLDCARNSLVNLSIEGLRSLTALNCADNALTHLDLGSNRNLQQFDGGKNRYAVIDLSPCAVSLQAQLRGNALLQTIYYRAGQQVDYESPATLVER